jgi:hypothetical protein
VRAPTRPKTHVKAVAFFEAQRDTNSIASIETDGGTVEAPDVCWRVCGGGGAGGLGGLGGLGARRSERERDAGVERASILVAE